MTVEWMCVEREIIFFGGENGDNNNLMLIYFAV